MSVPNFTISYSYWANIACFRKVTTREVIIELATYVYISGIARGGPSRAGPDLELCCSKALTLLSTYDPHKQNLMMSFFFIERAMTI